MPAKNMNSPTSIKPLAKNEHVEQEYQALLTPIEVTRIIGVSTRTLANWRWQGKGPEFVKLGGTPKSPVRYYKHALDTWLSLSKGDTR